MTVVIGSSAVLYVMIESTKTEEEEAKYRYYYSLTMPLADIFDIYVNIFLLWLLYKFMKPQEILEGGRTVASTLIFVHDHNKAGDDLLDSLMQD